MFPVTFGERYEISLHCAIAPVNVMEAVETQAFFIASADWSDLEFLTWIQEP